MNTIILLNGPPRCGKDTIADYLVQEHGFYKLKFADPIRQEVVSKFNITDADIEWWKNSHIGNNKTGREYMIAWSEVMMKPLHGNDYFGQIAGHQALSLLERHPRLVISDAGFTTEVNTLLRYIGDHATCTLWHVHRTQPRRGWLRWVLPDRLFPANPWKGDSREWVHTDLCPMDDLYNEHTLDDLYEEVDFMLYDHRVLHDCPAFV